MNIVTEYPAWYILLCLLLGAGYSLLLYYKERFFKELSPWVKRTMAVLRFLLVSILAALLLNPLLKTLTTEVEKPIIIIAQDNSSSLLMGKDSAFYNTEYKKQLQAISTELAKSYDVKTHRFGSAVSDGLKLDFQEKQTDISLLLDEINNTYSNRNVGAVVLATDGIYNKGASPLYKSSEAGIPIYTIALGDTAIKKDVLIKKVMHNRLAYLGNEFPMQILLAAKRYKGSTVKVSVNKNGKALFEKAVEINKNDFLQTIPVLLKAEKTGIQKYVVSVSQLEGEVSTSNNTQVVYIDVLDSRQKILILGAAPHPDIAALKHAIGNNDNYETDVKIAADFSENINEYNLAILHQLPNGDPKSRTLIESAVKSKTPLLFVIGSSTQIQYFNNLKTTIQIAATRGKSNESRAAINKAFTLFQLSDKARSAIGNLPPLTCPFGNYQLNNAAQVLLYQKIGMVDTDMPLLAFSNLNNKKAGVITGEGIWRWRLADYAENGNHDIFNEITSKAIQYLAVKEDKSLFRVKGKNSYPENEPITFEAEVYNQSYELFNEPEVRMQIKNSEGKTYTFNFSRTENAYRLNAGNLPIGEYTYSAQTKVGDQVLSEKGEFTVNEIRIESINTVANHQLLYNIANKTGGQMLYPNQLNELPKLLAQKEEIKPVSYAQKKLLDIINLKWIFFLLLALASIEWFMRKRNGAY